jgi:hypothetical protein
LFSDFCSLVCQLLGFPHHTFNRIFLQTCLDFIFNLVSTCMPNRFFVALFCIGNNIHYPGQSIVMIYHQSIEQLSIHIYHIYIHSTHVQLPIYPYEKPVHNASYYYTYSISQHIYAYNFQYITNVQTILIMVYITNVHLSRIYVQYYPRCIKGNGYNFHNY